MLGLSEGSEKRLAYGFWRHREHEVETTMETLAIARENGIDHLDTADIYGGADGFGASERLLGAIRTRAPELLKGTFIATKAGIEFGSPYNSSAAYLKAACDGSLSRLKVERLDLFYIHRPDLLTHPAELAATLDGLVEAGKIAAVGVSNFTVHQVTALAHFLKAPLRVHQIEFSAVHVAPLFDGTLDQAMERGIAVAAWSPLAGGDLFKDKTPECKRVREALTRIGKEHGATPAAVALAFLQQHPAGVTPILGTTNAGRLREALAANALTLTRRDWYAVVEAARGSRMP